MILLILGCLLLILAPFVSFLFMLYYSKKQDQELDLWEEYEEKIRDSFTSGFIVAPLVALFMIILGASCLSTNT